MAYNRRDLKLEAAKLFMGELSGTTEVYTREEEKEIFTKYVKAVGQEKIKIRNEILNANTKLVISIAMSITKCRDIQLILDNIQDGMFGLIRAIEKFKISKGYKFSTYATWWIRQSIQRGLEDKSFLIRTPSYSFQEYKRYLAVVGKYTEKYGKEPEQEYVMKKLGISKEKYLIFARKVFEPESLDRAVRIDPEARDTSSRIDLMNIPSDFSIEDKIENIENKDQLKQLLDCLNEREKRVILARFGFTTGEEQTLAQIGKTENFSREYARQIINKALKKMKRHADRLEILK